MNFTMKLLVTISILILGLNQQKICRCIFNRDYTPVCGANGKTYYNKCFMKCDEIKEFYKGIC